MLSPVSVIERKRDGHELALSEIEYFVSGYARGEVADYQMSALAMAIYLNGMTPQETSHLTRTMIATGDVLKPVGNLRRVDKHSTGGLGDKISLILAPLLACAGLHVPMISGRGLGITGGTLDKLEAIPGFRTDLNEKEIERALNEVGCVITGASENLVPADRKLYALRDVTATVPSIPLITASILSKKAAESLDALILDVKFGSGAFMQSRERAHALAMSLSNVGRELGIATSALLTDMSQPLGRMVGNANEVYESLDTLAGKGPADVRELTIELSARLLVQARVDSDLDSARLKLATLLDSGQAMERFEAMVQQQGGQLTILPSLAPKTAFSSSRTGFVFSMDGQRLGHAVIALGGGRKYVGQKIDPTVGLEMNVRVGDHVETGDPLLWISASPQSDIAAAQAWLEEAIVVSDSRPSVPALYSDI